MNNEAIGKKAALLSAIEIGLGSLLHGLHVPLAGHLLSLNQGFILSRAQVELQDKRAPGLISTTAAMLKSLSPAGKKLTPMLAIAMQGQLFGLGAWCAGNNLIGHMLGMTLLCLWGFIQPLFFYTLVFGQDLWGMGSFYLQQLQQLVPSLTANTVVLAVSALVGVKLVLGLGLVVLARKLSPEKVHAYEAWAMGHRRARSPEAQRAAWRQAWADLMSPFFLFTLFLLAVFWWFANSDHASLIWSLLRPVAIGYLVLLCLRSLPLHRLRQMLEKRSPTLARSLESALRYLER